LGTSCLPTNRSRSMNRLRGACVISLLLGTVTVPEAPERVGFPIRTDIMIDVEAGKLGQVVDRLYELDQVYYIALSTGDCDISVSAVATDMDALQTFITETLHAIQGVRKARVNVLTKILRQSNDWPFPEELR